MDDPALHHIYISEGHDYWGKRGEGRMCHGVSEPGEVECVAGMGLRGDRYFGFRADFKGQVTFFDLAVVEAVREKFRLPELPASVFRRNLVVSGIDLGSCIGRKFTLQGIEFEGTQECRPCHWMDRVIDEGAKTFLKEDFRGGLRAKVLTSGILRQS